MLVAGTVPGLTVDELQSIIQKAVEKGVETLKISPRLAAEAEECVRSATFLIAQVCSGAYAKHDYLVKM